MKNVFFSITAERASGEVKSLSVPDGWSTSHPQECHHSVDLFKLLCIFKGVLCKLSIVMSWSRISCVLFSFAFFVIASFNFLLSSVSLLSPTIIFCGKPRPILTDSIWMVKIGYMYFFHSLGSTFGEAQNLANIALKYKLTFMMMFTSSETGSSCQ